jgi:hypothetical protein
LVFERRLPGVPDSHQAVLLPTAKPGPAIAERPRTGVILTCPISSFCLTNAVPIPTPTPAERFAAILLWLSRAVAARIAAGLPGPLIVLIIGRLRHISQRVARLAARIRDGRYAPRRRSAPRRSPTIRRPRRPNPLPHKFGWLLKLVPEAAGYRAQLEHLLHDPEMAALLAAAPAPMARPLRSLCWMLRVPPPPILALAALQPAAPLPAPPQAAPAAAPRVSPPGPVASASAAPRRTVFAPMPPPARACGPPRPA